MKGANRGLRRPPPQAAHSHTPPAAARSLGASFGDVPAALHPTLAEGAARTAMVNSGTKDPLAVRVAGGERELRGDRIGSGWGRRGGKEAEGAAGERRSDPSQSPGRRWVPVIRWLWGDKQTPHPAGRRWDVNYSIIHEIVSGENMAILLDHNELSPPIPSTLCSGGG